MEYHRLARTPGHRWWRTLLGTLFILVGGAIVIVFSYLVVTAAAVVAGRPNNVDGLPSFGDRVDLVLAFATIAVLLPLTLLAARWIQRRPAGSLSSVTGRLRWRFLLTLLPVALIAVVVLLGGGLALSGSAGVEDSALAGWGPFLVSMGLLVLVVPLQAAAEEYLTRGWLLQAVGAWFRRPWVPIAFQALVFAAAHGWGTPWGFADLFVFGAVTGWLTVRTGGLEAAIALHVVNNLVAAGVAAAYNELTITETAADMPWQMFAVDLVVLPAYAVVVLILAQRMNPATSGHVAGGPQHGEGAQGLGAGDGLVVLGLDGQGHFDRLPDPGGLGHGGGLGRGGDRLLELDRQAERTDDHDR
ncbi:CPBP family intramembrane metalloprotease [Actinoplanes sp. TRM 88003]|uniref:CPBP family intramembrane metalloprotease n=1 Tax=Paractinoplanes aksuensis TaxID=2939490 RepID=A0ABT1DHH5_9ACTN|nr:CPBP family intramembrane glutamic endopeptidase [Actinoplanes aksuensis]MCO8270272.1 CPBP family intramembrane metalloprotease [Actinoplanes aksuensis]